MIDLKLIQNGDKCVLLLARLCFQDGVTALTDHAGGHAFANVFNTHARIKESP